MKRSLSDVGALLHCWRVRRCASVESMFSRLRRMMKKLFNSRSTSSFYSVMKWQGAVVCQVPVKRGCTPKSASGCITQGADNRSTIL